MLIEYVHSESFLHRLNPMTKLFWFIVVITTLFLFNNPLFIGIVLFLLFILFYFAHIPFRGVLRIFSTLMPIFIILFVMTSFSYEPNQFTNSASKVVYFYLFPNHMAPLTSGGILLGINYVLRISVMVISSLLLTYTTSVDDFIWFAQKVRIPYTVTFIITTAIRFIPTMEQKATMVLDAQRSRGADIDSGGIVKRIRTYSAVMVPMIVDSLRMSENLAMAMLCRGFGASKKPTYFEERTITIQDILLICFASMTLGGSIILRINGFGKL